MNMKWTMPAPMQAQIGGETWDGFLAGRGDDGITRYVQFRLTAHDATEAADMAEAMLRGLNCIIGVQRTMI